MCNLRCFLCAIGLSAMAGGAFAQQAEEDKLVKVVAKDISQVENPRELEKPWKEVINTPIAKAIGDAVR
jgi:hypothetical protein